VSARSHRYISSTTGHHEKFRAKHHLLLQVPEGERNEHSVVLHFVPTQNARGTYLRFDSFDDAYLGRLRAGDFRTQEHFSAYFSALIKIKLASRLKSPEAIEDVRQETFTRFFMALREEKILQPERLGSFVNSICNNVLFEHYRSTVHNPSLDDSEEQEIRASDFDLLGALAVKETEKKVREILSKLSERDPRLLRQIFLEERDKDEVCREFGVDREYLRVLLHRAKQAFKSAYLKHMGENPRDFAPA
jgi:RNA polymerase sigma-70 factor, ECF subfamily